VSVPRELSPDSNSTPNPKHQAPNPESEQVGEWETKFIKFPIKLEQYLMEGSYQKVLASNQDLPCDSYKMFVEMLSGTVRDSIAESMEAAYEGIGLDEGLRMLRMKSVEELRDYTAMRERLVTIPYTAIQDGQRMDKA